MKVVEGGVGLTSCVGPFQGNHWLTSAHTRQPPPVCHLAGGRSPKMALHNSIKYQAYAFDIIYGKGETLYTPYLILFLYYSYTIILFHDCYLKPIRLCSVTNCTIVENRY